MTKGVGQFFRSLLSRPTQEFPEPHTRIEKLSMQFGVASVVGTRHAAPLQLTNGPQALRKAAPPI
jgi:hypothetical protein